jgi:hypothetical protein
MKRLLLTSVTLVLATLLASASGATAATQTVDATLAGAAEWTGDPLQVETFSIHGTVSGTVEGTYSGTLNAGTYFNSNTCGPTCAPITGTIDFVTRRGSFSTTVAPGGLLTLFAIGSGNHYSFALTLQIVDGTRYYKHASGELSLSYGSDQNFNLPECQICPIADGGHLTGTIVRGPSAG